MRPGGSRQGGCQGGQGPGRLDYGRSRGLVVWVLLGDST